MLTEGKESKDALGRRDLATLAPKSFFASSNGSAVFVLLFGRQSKLPGRNIPGDDRLDLAPQKMAMDRNVVGVKTAAPSDLSAVEPPEVERPVESLGRVPRGYVRAQRCGDAQTQRPAVNKADPDSRETEFILAASRSSLALNAGL